LKKNGDFGMRLEISREEVLLDTGGGLKKVAWFFLEKPDEPFILHNVDVISTIDFQRMLQVHHTTNALVTLAVQQRDTSRYLLFDPRQQLCGRLMANHQPEFARGAELARPLAFSGIHVISPRIFSRIREEGVFPIIPVYLRLAAEGENIFAFHADDYYWRDLGRPEHVTQASQDFETKVLLP
jgi:NDP-sugar pyrophosphorylase family protein